MKFPRPHIGDFVKVKVTGAGIDTVGIVVGKLLFHNPNITVLAVRV